MVRRTMMDPTHALFYSWFAQIVEGANGRLDEAIRLIGGNSRGGAQGRREVPAAGAP